MISIAIEARSFGGSAKSPNAGAPRSGSGAETQRHPPPSAARGVVRLFAPQLYRSSEPGNEFSDAARLVARASRGKAVWPGIATERIGLTRPAREIVDQIALTRRSTSSPGHIHWSMKALFEIRSESTTC
jgi:hypothetical protein